MNTFTSNTKCLFVKTLGTAMASFFLASCSSPQQPRNGGGTVPNPDEEINTIGRTFYVSSKQGNDANNGLSPNQAFKTLNKINGISLGRGDWVRLERGSVFDDQFLHIKGSGEEGAPIRVFPYGTGNRPKINTNGKGQWYQDYGRTLDNPNHQYKGTVSSSVLLADVSYIEISGLEITNTNGGPDPNGLAYNDFNTMNRTGVAGYAKDRGTLKHVILDDLYIHDVTGNVYAKHMLNGGIYFACFMPSDEGKTGIPRYDGLTIKNCYLDKVNRWGIAAAYTAYSHQFLQAAISDAVIQKYGSLNVRIENNYVKDAGGDSITTMYCDRPLIQYNVSQGAARQINTTNYRNGYPAGGRVAAGIWPWKCKNALFQYNECFDTQNGSNGNDDAQAWDADSGDGTLYQYNYSHGNTGGTVMFCLQQAVNSTFRYNISQNDLRGLICIPSNPDAHIYNNTFYIKEGVPFIYPKMSNGKATIENNIMYYAGSQPRTGEDWRVPRLTYDNNLYVNYAAVPANDANAKTANKTSAIFTSPGTAPTAPLSPGQGVHQRTDFAGYTPADGSPAVGSGKVITDENGFAVDRDFMGNKVKNPPAIGAIEK